MDLFAASVERQMNEAELEAQHAASCAGTLRPPIAGLGNSLWICDVCSFAIDKPGAQVAPVDPAAVSIFDRASCLLLEFKKLGVSRKVAAGAVAPDGTDPDVLHVAKDLISCDELSAIDSHDGETRRWIAARSLPAKVLKAGIHLMPNPRISEAAAWLKLRQGERAELVRAFCDVYPERAATSRAKLGPLADISEYPPVDKVRAAFGVRIQWLQFQTPAQLKEVDPELYEREARKAAAAWGGVLDEARDGLRLLCSELVAAMAEKLTVAEGEKPKVFRDSLVNNLNEFTKLFDDLNYVAGDAQLAELVAKIRGILKGVKPADLRTKPNVRQAVADSMGAIRETLDQMTAERATRAYYDESEA
jgi:hypothetical protein